MLTTITKPRDTPSPLIGPGAGYHAGGVRTHIRRRGVRTQGEATRGGQGCGLEGDSPHGLRGKGRGCRISVFDSEIRWCRPLEGIDRRSRCRTLAETEDLRTLQLGRGGWNWWLRSMLPHDPGHTRSD